MTRIDPPSEVCQRCGCPLVGNESYCSHCGRRLDPRRRRGIALVVLVSLVVLGAAGTCVYRSKAQAVPPAGARPNPPRLAS
ncbi:MAG TPA: hypothetical protein VN032_01260 [Thermoanaerobaculia bacterium]|jgi:hypothetical protein|nr:hypothetical protein [Thermoanaerobaculia bacterium]